MQHLQLSIAARSQAMHATNEDAYIVADLTRGVLLTPGPTTARIDIGERGALVAVSDGLGGHQGGEVASALVVRTLAQSLARAPSTAPSDALLHAAVERAHEVVRNSGNADEARKGMGATLTALFVHGSSVWVAAVGDSRAYLVRAGTIAPLTHDQNYAQLLFDHGALSARDAERSPLRNVLLQAMGHGAEDVQVELGELDLRNRDAFIVCSDGLTKCVGDEEIKQIVLSSPRLDAACARMVDLAEERGADDDITVVVAGVAGPLPASRVSEPIGETFDVIESFDPRRIPTDEEGA